MKKLSFLLLSFLVLVGAFGQTTSAKVCPCCTEEFRQFDFWVGDWVTSSNGNIVGYNTIDIIQDSCIVRENWTAANSPYTGTSYNYYDRASKSWNQLWIDNGGNPLKLSGGLKDDKMILLSDPATDNNGNVQIHRVIWTLQATGEVRQLWESSNDGGQIWTVAFDGMYKRKEK